MGRQSPLKYKVKSMGRCVPVFPIVYIICISIINPQGLHLRFRWNVSSIIFIPGYCYSWHYNKDWGNQPDLPEATKPYVIV